VDTSKRQGRLAGQLNASDARPSDVADLRQWSLMGDVVTLKCVGKYMDAIERGGLYRAGHTGHPKGSGASKSSRS
jgi:hypothetical protein